LLGSLRSSAESAGILVLFSPCLVSPNSKVSRIANFPEFLINFSLEISLNAKVLAYELC
jgi:hypothetical protein